MNAPIVDTVEPQKLYHNALKALLEEHKATVSPLQMLAVTAHLVGVLAALQDPAAVTAEQSLALIQFNMEAGNSEALAQLEGEPK